MLPRPKCFTSHTMGERFGTIWALQLLFFAMGAKGLDVLGPTGPVEVPPGASVLLPCSVETGVDLQEVEVLWSRSDSGTIVGLFQDGESRPESQDPVYGDRAHFFPHETPKGNFSLLVENVTTGDAGVYKCVVHTNTGSDETLVEVTVERLRVTGPDKPLFTHAGGDVIVNCSVDTHVPVEELEVEWVKSDEEMLVLLFAEGENKAESQHERYRDRAEFFTDEIPKGNFSMRLRGLRTEDKGQYVCKVHTETTSANATALLQALGYSSLHKLEISLCISVILVVMVTSVLFLWKLKKKDELRAACCLQVITPGFMLFLAFVLWGQIEGTFDETVICSTVSLVRMLALFMAAPSGIVFKGKLWCAFEHCAMSIEFGVIGVTLIVVRWIEFWTKTGNTPQVFQFLAVFAFVIFLFQGFVSTIKMTGKRTRGINSKNTIYKAVLFGMTPFLIIFFILMEVIRYHTILRIGFRTTCGEFSLFLVLMVILWVQHRRLLPVTAHNLVYVSGVVGLPLVNSVALLTELILKAERGEHTVDLRLIVLPCDTIFLTGWLILLIYAYCAQKKKKQVRSDDLWSQYLRSFRSSFEPRQGHPFVTFSGAQLNRHERSQDKQRKHDMDLAMPLPTYLRQSACIIFVFLYLFIMHYNIELLKYIKTSFRVLCLCVMKENSIHPDINNNIGIWVVK